MSGTENGTGLNPSHFSLVKRITRLLAAHKGTLAGILVSSLVLNLFGLVAPRFTQAILDHVLPQSDFTLLTQLILVLVLVTVFQILLTIWRRLTLVRLSLTIDRVVLAEFLGHVLSLPIAFFKQHQTGDLVARWSEHGHVRHLLAGGLTRVAIDALMVVVYFIVMFVYSVQLALVVVGLLLLFGGYMALRSPFMQRQHRRLLDEKGAHEARLIEMMTGIDQVKAMAIEKPLRQKWEEELQGYLASNYRTQKLRQILESGGTAIQFLCTGALLWYGVVLVLENQLSTGALVAFTMYTSQALSPLLSLIGLWDDVQLARGALERIEEVRKQIPEMGSGQKAIIGPKRLMGKIQFEQVWFHYDGSDRINVLRGAAFEALPGERIALMGPSGSGKTTVTRLLLGLYGPTQGRILIDGYPLEHLDLQSFRQQIGVVMQDNLLFSGTIRGNIALGDPQADLERVMEVARMAAAHDFIMGLPQGYDTIVGELGLTLSGGQRQRIGLARALYRNPRILILDEALSALDNSSTQLIRQNWETMVDGRTVLVIAHNLLTAQMADRILLLDQGLITEEASRRDFSDRSVEPSPSIW